MVYAVVTLLTLSNLSRQLEILERQSNTESFSQKTATDQTNQVVGNINWLVREQTITDSGEAATPATPRRSKHPAEISTPIGLFGHFRT
jgi:hypothetical protein